MNDTNDEVESTRNVQNVTFNYLNFSIEARVTWYGEGPEFDVEFFNPQTGWTNSSNPSSIMNNWSYNNYEDNYEISNLIEAINNFEDWTDRLDWTDGAHCSFTFKWDGESYLSYEYTVNYNSKTGEPEVVYYKQLDWEYTK